MKLNIKSQSSANRSYISPEIFEIALDNDISLALESTNDLPPDGPWEEFISQNNLQKDPLQSA